MTRRRDIEPVLDAWFRDGPTEMPDRLFEAVLDRVDRTPQGRFARLNLRFAAMNPNVRIATVAAVVVVAAGVGFATLGRSPDNGHVGASPSPSSTSSPAASAGGQVPVELRERWMGGVRPDISEAGAGTSIVFAADTVATTQSNAGDVPELISSASSLGGDKLRVLLAGDSAGCNKSDVGVYSWSLSASKRTLTITADSDDCAPRLASFPGVWWHMGCTESGDFCLGDIDAGTYSSQYFDPFVPSGGAWKPRFDALRYTVPAGWANGVDYPSTFSLRKQTAPNDSAIFIWSDVAIVSNADSCSETPEPSVAHAADAVANWMTTAPGVVASEPRDVSLGGLSGGTIDVSMDPAWTQTCPFSDGKPRRSLFTDTVAGPGLQWGLGAETRMRLYILDVGDGRTVVVDIEGQDKLTYDSMLGEASSIVESLVFTR